MLNPDFEEYFETVRKLAGEEGPGRKLPKFEQHWYNIFNAGHVRRIEMWKRRNQEARERLEEKCPKEKVVNKFIAEGKGVVRAKL